MTPAALITALHTAGCRLIPHGEQLRIQDPQQALTDAWRQAIRQHKAVLLALLEAWAERASIIEFDGRVPRDEAERLAWACVLGEERPAC